MKKTKKEGCDVMRPKTVKLVVLTLMLLLCSLTKLLALGRSEWSLEVRIAAHPSKDVLIVNKAKSNLESQLYESGSQIAKWVPVLESKEDQLLKNPHLVTRRNDKGQVELLVLLCAYDITEQHVQKIKSGKDKLGRLALDIELDSAGAIKLKHLTRDNLSTSTNIRHAAQIIEGQVYAAPEIVSIVGEYFQIPGNFTNIMIDEIAKRTEDKFEKVYTPSPYAITFTPLRILILLLILFTLILGLLPTTGLKESKHPRAWIAAGIVAGIVIGGYLFGAKSSDAGSDTQQSAWGLLIHISIMGVLLSSLIGGVLGIAGGYLLRFFARRAIHNIYRLSKNVISALLPKKSTVIIKSLQERKKRYLNKKQSVVLCSSVLLILLFIIFPPWIGSRTRIIGEDYPEGYAGEDYEFIGFHFIFSGRDVSFDTLFIITKIDYRLFALLSCGTAVLSGLLMFLVRSPSIRSQRT